MAIKKVTKNNFTTPEQSKRLLELGVPVDSADCVYDCALIGGEKYYSLGILEDELFSAYKRIWEDSCTDIIPCWSVGRLIEIYRILANCGCCIQYNDDIIETLIWDIKAGMFDEDDFSKLEE